MTMVHEEKTPQSTPAQTLHSDAVYGFPPNVIPVLPMGFAITAQHERLLLELLPFKDSAQFHEWLAGLDGNFEEYCKAYYDDVDPMVDPEPDKTRTAELARDAINKRLPKYLAYHPDKTGWMADDHAVRFIVTVTADSLLRQTWSDSDWRRRPVDITKAVYEVLSFKRTHRQSSHRLQAQFAVLEQRNRLARIAQGESGSTTGTPNAPPPQYDGLN